MGIFNLFKKRTQEPTITELTFDEAELLLQQKGTEAETQLEDVLSTISENTKELTTYLNERAAFLESIDLSKRKEYEKLKQLTIQGIEEYAEQLRRLARNIERIPLDQGAHRYIQEIDTALNTFLKNSFKKYHRATILVGDEISEIQERIQTFYKDIDTHATNNHEHLLALGGIKQLIEHKETIREITNTINTIDEDIKALKTEHENTIRNIEAHIEALETAQKSEAYQALLQEKKAITTKQEENEREITKIRNNLDLKAITKRVHGHTKQRDTVARYRDNFTKALSEDKELLFLEALNEIERKETEITLRNAQKNKETLNTQKEQCKPETITNPIEHTIRTHKETAQELLDRITIEEKKRTKNEEEQKEKEKNLRTLLETALPNLKITD